jgi:hypothetical protein
MIFQIIVGDDFWKISPVFFFLKKNSAKFSKRYAVDELAVFGCDKDRVYRLGWGQTLR